MTRILLLALFSAVAPVTVRPLALVPTGAPMPEPASRYAKLRPIPWIYRPLDMRRQNLGLNARKNATEDEQRQDITPELQPRPLSGGRNW